MKDVRGIVHRLTSASFVRGVAIMASGSAAAQAIPVLVTPILTRLYLPSDMGQLALYLAFLSTVSPIASLQYSKAIVAARSDNDATLLLAASVLLVAPMALISSAIILLLVELSWLGFGQFSPLVAVAMCISLVLSGLFTSLRFYSLRYGAYRTISAATIQRSLGRILVQVAYGVINASWIGLVLGEMVGRSLGLRSLMGVVDSRARGQVTRMRDWGQMRQVAREYRKFPLLSAPSMLINSMALAAPAPLISEFFGIAAAGQYTVASRVLLIPLVLIGTAVGDVFHRRLAIYARAGAVKARRFFVRVVVGLLVVGVGPMALIMLVGPSVFAVVLGDDWREAGRVASAIAPWALAQFVVTPVSQVVPVYQRQEIKLVYDILGLLSVVGTLFVSHLQQWSFVEACVLIGWSQAAVYLLYLFLLSRMIRDPL